MSVFIPGGDTHWAARVWYSRAGDLSGPGELALVRRRPFVSSWPNPDARHVGWGLDIHATAVLDALNGVERIWRYRPRGGDGRLPRRHHRQRHGRAPGRRLQAGPARRGYLDGRALAGAFALLHPGDLVWNYWVSNYLLGKTPPASDVLSWYAGTTRMSARLHADFAALAMDNKPGLPGS